MSFQFPKPSPGSTNTSSYSAYEFDHIYDHYDEIHMKLMRCSGPDYDELIIPLSHYAFNRLSPSDQEEQLVEISSHHEENDFTELFKKLKYSDQVKFLREVLQKLKFQRLISSFKQLVPKHQHRVIEQLANLEYSSLYGLYHNLQGDPEAEDQLPDSEETEENFRLRRFTQLCKGHCQDTLKMIDALISGGDQLAPPEETSDDWKLRFSDFFVGFASIWFQGQFASGQEMLIEQLSEGVEGDLIEKCIQKKSEEEDLKLRRFTELCMKVVDFRVQENFLDNVEKKLNTYDGWSLEPQDYESAAKLFCDLSTLGFSKLSAKHQYQMIEEMSTQVQSKVLKTKTVIRRVKRHPAAEDLQTSSTDPEEEAIRIGRFRELFNQVSDLNRFSLLRELRISLKHKQYFEAVQIFCGLGTKDQLKMTKKMADMIWYSDHDTIEFHKFSQREEEFVKSSVESEEDIRQLCSFEVASEGRDSFASEWIKVKLPDLQRQGAAATTTPPVVSAAAGSATNYSVDT